jgi:hypothetical protein
MSVYLMLGGRAGEKEENEQVANENEKGEWGKLKGNLKSLGVKNEHEMKSIVVSGYIL